MYYRVIPYEQSFDSYGLIYKIPESYTSYELIGRVGEFPFGKKTFRGIFAEILDEFSLSDLKYEVKEMQGLISGTQILSPHEIEMIDFIAKYYFCQIHLAGKLYLSGNLLKEISSLKYFSRKQGVYKYKSQIIQLTTAQSEIYKKLRELPVGSTSLLYGVTGSGKTQIYIKLIEDTLKAGGQSLLLIPEIILTSQIGEKLQKHFGDDVILIHSGISAVKKVQYFKDISLGNARIIIGTRSALFYPYKNLKYIIIDEEHDKSYISDTSPRYHVKTLALKMSKIYNCSILLGSGTPELTSLYKGLSGEYHLFQMLESYKK